MKWGRQRGKEEMEGEERGRGGVGRQRRKGEAEAGSQVQLRAVRQRDEGLW